MHVYPKGAQARHDSVEVSVRPVRLHGPWGSGQDSQAMPSDTKVPETGKLKSAVKRGHCRWKPLLSLERARLASLGQNSQGSLTHMIHQRQRVFFCYEGQSSIHYFVGAPDCSVIASELLAKAHRNFADPLLDRLQKYHWAHHSTWHPSVEGAIGL